MRDWVKIRNVQLLIGLTISISSTLLIKFGAWKVISENFNHIPALFLMLLSALFIRYILIKIYDCVEIDFFSIESYKANIKYKPNDITQKLNKFNKLGWFGIFIILIIVDPTIAAIYYRPNYFNWNGLKNPKTKILFVLGNLIAVITWGNIIAWIF